MSSGLSETVSLQHRGDVALLIVDNPPVNALSHSVRVGLLAGIEELQSDDSCAAIVLACAGRTFIAGADIREFAQPPKEPHMNEVRALIEASGKPVTAAINGTALGGGLETAMACHYRVATSTARFGLPEVKLGILPGGGGTQRLPRIVGVEKALQMIVTGERVGAREALELGLIDEIVDGDLVAGAVRLSARVVEEGRPLRRVRDRDDKLGAVGEQADVFAEFRRKIARRTRGFEAPEKCIQAVEAAVELPFDEGLKRERELFADLVSGEQSKAQRYYFFAERAAQKVADVAPDTPLRPILSAGVLGAGTMGGGIAMNFANAGLPVTLVEVKEEALDRGLLTIRHNYERSMKRGRFTQEEIDRRLALISGSLELEQFAGCDVVIEAVFENLELKKEVFRELDRVCGADAIMATNTSYLDVDEIAAVTARPESVLGTHFFSPANVMKLVEVVRGRATATDVLATTIALGKKLGKIPVVVGVCHGFVGNRMLAQRRAQADSLVLEGAMPWDVDRVLYDFGLPMGPFAMSDLAGLDIGWQRQTSASRTLREILCERGRFGQKTGAGYYLYDARTRAASPDPEVEEVIHELAARQGVDRRDISDDEILARCTYPMINEGAKILAEGIAARASDIDVIWVNGYGWPVYRGGPMFYADTIGVGTIVDAYDEFRERLEGDWEVAPLMRQLASEGRGFLEIS